MKNIIKSPVLFFGAVLGLLAVLRLPLVSVPIYNVDEAIFVTFGSAVLKGQVIYREAVETCALVTPWRPEA